MEQLEMHFLVVQVVLKITQKQLNAVLHHVLLMQMLQKMLDVAIKRHVLKKLMELLVVPFHVLQVQVLK